MHAAYGARLKGWFAADAQRTDGSGWAFNLAIFRIVFLGFAVLPFARLVSTWTAHVMPNLPPGVWQPISFYRYIAPPILTNAGLAHGLAVADVALIVAALAGAGTRYALGIATVLSTYVFGLMENQGKVDHLYHHVIWFMAVLAAGPSGHVLSLDAIVRAVRRADRGLVQPESSSLAPLWTLRYAWVLLGLLYLVPGLAKLQAALAAHWAAAENLRHLMWRKWFELALYEPGFVLAARVDHLPSWVLGAFGWGAILFEAGCITLVLWRSTRWLAAAVGIAFHTLNGWVLRIPFSSLQFAYVCLVDWVAVGRWLAARMRQQPLVVLYDDECRLCRRTIAALRTLDVWDALDPVGIGMQDSPRRPAWLTYDMLIRDVHVIRGGQRLRGYDGYVAIATRMPLLWPLGLIMRLPTVSSLGRAVYRRVADTRRCPAVRRRPGAERSRPPGAAVVHFVGIFLLVAQTAVSGANYTAGMRLSFVPHPIRPAVKAGLAKFASWRWTWPFDTYPTFAGIVGGDQEVWEPRVVFQNGEEKRVAAEAYATLCRSATCVHISHGLLNEHDPMRFRARSLEMVRHLWRYESARTGPHAVGVRVYHARYDMDPSRPRVIEQRLLCEFPVEIL